MKIAIVGNKIQNNTYNLSEYDIIVRCNGMTSLDKSYSHITHYYFFGGHVATFENKQLTDKLLSYIKKNCNKLLTFTDFIPYMQNLIKREFIDIFSSFSLEKCCNKINFTYNDKLKRITSIYYITLYILYCYVDDESFETIDIYCLDKERKEKNNWHIYPEEEYKLICFLEKNKFIKFIY